MISIERDTHTKERYTFNRPFADVELQFGRSSEDLGDLDLNGPTIAWMDNVSKVDGTVLADCSLPEASSADGAWRRSSAWWHA